MHAPLQRLADASCFASASASAWRAEAESLREHAQAAYLTERQRVTLLREAEAADRQADWWLDAIGQH
jgi:hypothetical protein